MRDEQGQAMVEFAIVVTVLLLIVTGIIYFGRFLNYAINMTHMANVGARYAAVNSDPSGGSGLKSYISGLAPSGLTVTVYIYPNGSSAGSSAQVGQPITACVQASIPLNLIPFIHLSAGTLTRSATMRSETAYTTPDSEATAAGAGCPS